MQSSGENPVAPSLRTEIVLTVAEESCTTWSVDGERTVDFAPFFPGERTKRVSPGHLVAIASVPSVGTSGGGGDGLIVWRWFDAVVLGEARDRRVRIWEPGHGEVVAALRPECRAVTPGRRVWASAGLPGAEWWIADTADGSVEGAGVELGELRAFLAENISVSWAAAAPRSWSTD